MFALNTLSQAVSHRSLLLLAAVLLSACSSTPSGRYSLRHDAPPTVLPSEILQHDATPKKEPHNPVNQRSYVIRGKTYHPISPDQAVSHSEKGMASWYGQKFHGHLTSNGETYDMYSMSAAHKTLPLPSYVQVTNLDNGKKAIVRVNDRGPFHQGRIIDLSYAAALKLDVLKTGVANVQIEVISVDDEGRLYLAGKPLFDDKPEPQQLALNNSEAWFVQVLALQDADKARDLAKGLQQLYQTNIHTPEENGVHRLRLGPLKDEQSARQLADQLKADGYPSAFPLLTAY